MGELIGHLHPLLVHLPIGILSLAFLIELAGRKKAWSYLHQSLPFILGIALLSSIVSVGTGWLIPKEGMYNEDLLDLHFWFAVALTVSIAGLYYLNQTENKSYQKLYFPTFILSMTLLILTGHYGGSMTHGSDYLWSTTKKTTSIKKVEDVNTLAVYPDIILPIFQTKCYKCHNGEKQKGKLNMATIDDLKKGGEGGAIFVKGNIEESTLIFRAHLPIEDEEHMPPEGKPQLDRQEIRLIEWWIKEGADFESKVGALNKPEVIATILEKYKDDGSYYGDQIINPIASETLIKIKAKTNASIITNSSSPLLSVSFARDTTLTVGKIKALKSIKDNINELDLSMTNTNDKILYQVKSLKNLQKLKLGKTQISSNGLKIIMDLPYLQILDIHNTAVDNSVSKYLSESTLLTEVYAWQTNLKDEDLEELSTNNPLLKINTGVQNELFTDAQLLPPAIVASRYIFEDTVSVSLKYNFDRAQLTYTIDGSIPSINSLKYEQPFIIDKTTTVRAAAFLDGWDASVTSENTFVQAKYKPISAKLSAAPSDQYKANGSTSLIDFLKGSTDFRDGKWLGYQAQDVITTIDLGASKTIRHVTIGALEATASYIFFPKQIIVQSSERNGGYKEMARLDIPIAKEAHAPEIKSFLLSFDEHAARYIRVLIKGHLRNPDWHAAPGAKNWLFIDEVLVN